MAEPLVLAAVTDSGVASVAPAVVRISVTSCGAASSIVALLALANAIDAESASRIVTV